MFRSKSIQIGRFLRRNGQRIATEQFASKPSTSKSDRSSERRAIFEIDDQHRKSTIKNRISSADGSKLSTPKLLIDPSPSSIDTRRASINRDDDQPLDPRHGRLDDLFRSLESGREYRNMSILTFAAHFSFKLGRREEFVRIVDKWFDRVRPILRRLRTKWMEKSYDEVTHDENRIKLASWLIHLGKLNEQTDGEIRRRLKIGHGGGNGGGGGKFGIDGDDRRNDEDALELLVRSLIVDPKFYDLAYMDVNSALTGIRDLLTFPVDQSSSSFENYRPLLVELANAVDRYLVENFYGSNTDKDEYESVVRVGALSTLGLLEQLRLHPRDRDVRHVFKTLCDLAKRALNVASDEASVLDIDRTTLFANFWIRWNVDPEGMFKGVWSDWRRTYERNLRERFVPASVDQPIDYSSFKIKLEHFDHILAVAHFFNQHELFWSIFPLWYRSFKPIFDDPPAQSSSKTDQDQVSSVDRSIRHIKPRDLCDLFYSFALVWTKSRHRSMLPTEATDANFARFLSSLERTIIRNYSPDDADMSIEPIWMHRLLWALTQLKPIIIVGESQQTFPSYELLEFLIEWTDRLGRDAKADRSVFSDTAATIVYMLRFLIRSPRTKNFDHQQQQQQRRSDWMDRTSRDRQHKLIDRILESSSIMYDRGLDRIAERDLTRALSYFAIACSQFHYDPSTLESIDGRRFWPRWFRQCRNVLSNFSSSSLSSSKGDSKKVMKLLMSMIFVGMELNPDGFVRSGEIWRRCVWEMYESGVEPKSESHSMIGFLEKIRRKTGARDFDEFIEKLKRLKN